MKYEEWIKGVSIVSDRLPYALKIITSYPIAGNSKAAKGLLV